MINSAPRPERLIGRQAQRFLDETWQRMTGLPSLLLMETAGQAVARLLRTIDPDPVAPVLLLAGSGNNGGDAYVCARYLLADGQPVRLRTLDNTDPQTADCRTYRAAWENLGQTVLPFSVDDLVWLTSGPTAGWLIDGLYGVGFKASRPAVKAFKRLGHMIRQARQESGSSVDGPFRVLAIDCPSGLDVDSGIAVDCVCAADDTLTFYRDKIGMATSAVSGPAGKTHVDRIGLSDAWIDAALDDYDRASTSEKPTWRATPDWLRSIAPERPASGHKGLFGRVLLIGGAPGMSGALLLAAEAAARAGVGLCHAAVPQASLPAILAARPELLSQGIPDHSSWLEPADDRIGSMQAVAIGPGLGHPPWLQAALIDLIDRAAGLVIDADALNAIAADPDVYWHHCRTRTQENGLTPPILTPHPGEFRRLAPDIDLSDRRQAALTLARRSSCLVVFKGANSIIAAPDGSCWVNPTGNVGLARGGSGDVLTGLVAGILAQMKAPLTAAVAGVYLHGLAADMAARELGQRAMLPGDVIQSFGAAFAACGWDVKPAGRPDLRAEVSAQQAPRCWMNETAERQDRT